MKKALILAAFLLAGCDLDVKSDTGETDWTDIGDTDTEVADGEGCEALFETADGTLAAEVIACIEGAFEESGYNFDAPACDELEGAWYIGGETDALWASCQSDEGFGDAVCDLVLTACF